MGRLRAVLGRLFDIRAGEWQRLLLLYMLAFVLNASVVWGYAASDALFLERLGVKNLPLMFIADALLTAVAIIFYGPFVDRISNAHLMIAICVLGSLILAFARVGLAFDLTLAYPLLYLLQCILKASISIHAWTYIADFYDTRTAKRHFPLISSGSRVSGVLAGCLILPLTRFFNAESLILAWMVGLLASAWLAWITPRLARVEVQPESRPSPSVGLLRNMRDGFGFVASSGFLRVMAAAAFMGSMLLYLLEYQSQFILKESFVSAEDLASFYGALGAVANLITLPIQVFLLSRLVVWLGVGNASLIFPGLSAISYGLLGLVPSLPTAALAREDRKALRSAFRTPIDGLLFNAVPLAVKGRARAVINGLVVPLGGLVAGLVLLMVRQGWLSLAFLTGLGLVVAGAYIVASLRLRTQYAKALIAMLEQEDFSFLLAPASDLAVTDSATLSWLTKKLEASTSSDFTIFMARLISQVGGSEAIPILRRAAESKDARVRSTIVDILVAADMRGDAVRQLYTDFLADPDGRVRQSAVAGLEQLAGAESEEFLALALELLRDPDIDVRAQVIPSLVRSGDFFYLASAVQALNQLLTDSDPYRRARGVRVLGQIGDVRFIRDLVPYLADSDDQVRLAAAVAIESLSQGSISSGVTPLVLEPVSALRHDPVERVRRAAVAILERVGSQEAHQGLVGFLADPCPVVRETAVEALVQIGESVVSTVSPALDAADPQLGKMASIVLSHIDREQFGALIESRINDNLISVYRHHGRLEALSPWASYPSVAIMQSMLREQNQQLTDEIFYLLAAVHDPEAVEIIAESLNDETARVRANAIEALEALITLRLAGLITPLFAPEFVPSQLLRISQETWGLAHPDTAQVIRQFVTDPDDPWGRAVMTFALGEIGAKTPQPTFDPLADEVSLSGQKEGQARHSRLTGLLDRITEPAEDVSLPPTEGAEPPTLPTLSEQLPFTLQEIESMLESSLSDPVADVRIAARAAKRMISGLSVMAVTQEGKTMLSTVERIIFLKEVPFFQSLKIDQLKVLAGVCEEELFEEDAQIFEQGDPGGTLYVVINGRVGIEREGKRKGSFKRLATIEAHSYFGEMSLFDESPRSAAAIAIQDTLTLQLRREPLIALIRQYPDLSLELINVLSQRLRAANDQIVQLTRSKPRELQKLYDRLD